MYWSLADLGMGERVKGGWCVYVCVLHALRYIEYALLSRLHSVEPDRATWQAAHIAFTQAFVEPPDTVQQQKLAKIIERPLPKEVKDALFKYEGFLHGLGRMNLSA